MPHIVCVTSGLAGILLASFEFVRRVEACGFRVTYLSPSDVREPVEAQGIPFVQLPPLNQSPVSSGARGLGGWVDRQTKRAAYLTQGREALGLEETGAILRDLAPDLVIADEEMHESILASVEQGLPVVLLSQWFSHWRGGGLPPITSDLVPGGGGRSGHLGIEWEWTRQSLWRRRAAIVRRLRGQMGRGDVLKSYAEAIGFPTREMVRFSFPSPFIYRSLPVVAMVPEALEFPHDRRAELHYIGPVVCESRPDLKGPDGDREEVQALLSEHAEAAAPLVYCTVSSMNTGSARFFGKLLQVFEKRSEWGLIIGLGGKTPPEALGPLPANVRAFSWTPQLDILRVADVSINHGGVHTINECLHFGVPMAVYSGKKYDQDGCAARVGYHGIGLVGDAETDDAAAIENSIHRLLTEPEFGEAIRSLSQRNRSADLCALLERFSGPGSEAPTPTA